jgi:hypothetical protein
LLGLWG